MFSHTGEQLGENKFPDFGKEGTDCVLDEIFIKVP